MSQKKKWQDPLVPIAERVELLLSELTVDEKIELLDDASMGVERVGLERFPYYGEVLHGLCLTGKATTFPMPVGMASTFDEPLVERIAEAVSDEMRAKFHAPEWKRSPKVALFVFSPVINILRDPRWGRAQETYGEDPWLTSRLGAAYVRGLQGNDPKRLKLAACAKHLGVHSGPESLRAKFNAVVSRKDLYETYLPAFEALVEEGVASVMATYNRVNGEHCCAHSEMIGAFLRERLGYDGVVFSDGGALGSLHKRKKVETAAGVVGMPTADGWGDISEGHELTEDRVETAALCLENQLDFELGTQALCLAKEAIERGRISEAEIDRAARRVLTLQFRTGFYDADADESDHPYTRIPISVINSDEHVSLALEAARKSIVLLKNDNDTLPLRAERDPVVLVTGPTSVDLQVLLGNFYRGSGSRLVSFLEGITGEAPDGVTVTNSQGAFLTHPNVYDSTWFLGLAEWAQAVVACVGFSPLMEGEQGECIGAPDGGDKASVALPDNQIQFLRKVRAGLDRQSNPSKLIVVVTGGCPMELAEVHELADAVLMAWYPGEQGGTALGEILWGRQNPSGKLCATFPRSLEDLPPYEDYALKGRTYRFQEKDPLYPFGFGLSYTEFRLEDFAVETSGDAYQARVTVLNTGSLPGEEVVQLYASWPGVKDSPRCELKAFGRVSIEPGQTGEITLEIDPKLLRPFNADGERITGPLEVVLTAARQAPVPSIAGAQVEQISRRQTLQLS